MITRKNSGLLLSALAIGLLFACTKDDESKNEPQQLQLVAKEQPSELNTKCSYVDANWSSTAVLSNTMINSTQTNFINGQNTKISNVWSRPLTTLKFVVDPSNPNSTYNAISYSSPKKIYFGEAIYKAALAKGQIVPAMILAHEFGHQLQYTYGLPSVTENTARPNELEADGFAGYYMRKPSGYNATWAAAGPAFEFAFAIGDYNTSSSGHHGTPPQRRSATRLGWYLGEYNLTATSFDSNFFYYYNNVLSGSYRKARPSNITPEMDAFILSKMDELRKINSGEITKEQFEKLND
jgi:hypothetical protein